MTIRHCASQGHALPIRGVLLVISLALLTSVASAAVDLTRIPAKRSWEVWYYNDWPNVYDDWDVPCVKIANRNNSLPDPPTLYLNPRGYRKPSFGFGCLFDISYIKPGWGYPVGTTLYDQYSQGWIGPRYSCPAGYSGPDRRYPTAEDYYYDCTRSATTPQISKQNESCEGNPTMPGSGIKVEAQTDYSAGARGLLRYERIYRGRSGTVMAGTSTQTLGRTGQLWNDTYSRRVSFIAGDATAPDLASVARPDGRVVQFGRVGTNWEAEADIADRLVELKDGTGLTTGWRFVNAADDSVELYDASGVLQMISARSGETLTLTYSTSATATTIAPGRGYLIAVSDAFGRQLQFRYDGIGRLVKLIDPDNKETVYTYAANNTLTAVTYPDLKTKTYLYENTTLPFALTGIVDENGARFATYA